jgi:hypothetical protein
MIRTAAHDDSCEGADRRRRAHGPVSAIAALALLWAGTAHANDPAPQQVPPEYKLNAYVPGSAGGTSAGDASAAPEFFYRLPSSFVYETLTGLDPDTFGSPTDRGRATMRTTWLANSSWAMKVGMSNLLEPDTTWQRMMLAATDHPRISPMPSMHVAGESQLSEHWMLTLDAEGQHWTRGQTLDMDLRLNYHLTPTFALFGSYRLTDNFGEDLTGFPVSNSARLGVRLDF